MFRQGRLPKPTLICIKANFARRFLAALRAATRLSRPTDRHQTRNRSGNARLRRPARHAVLKSATTKINYKKREAARDSGDPTMMMMMMAIEMASGTRWPARWGSQKAHERQLSNLWTSNLASARLKRPECEATRSWPVAD